MWIKQWRTQHLYRIDIKRPKFRNHLLLKRSLWTSLILALTILGLGGLGFWLIDPRIHSFSDGLWLAFTTAATVGYGDLVPSTMASRLFSVLVVLLGLAVLSLVTASLAAVLLQEEEREFERELMRELTHELRQMRNELKQVQERQQAQIKTPEASTSAAEAELSQP